MFEDSPDFIDASDTFHLMLQIAEAVEEKEKARAEISSARAFR
jgi:hypothetical protein